VDIKPGDEQDAGTKD